MEIPENGGITFLNAVSSLVVSLFKYKIPGIYIYCDGEIYYNYLNSTQLESHYSIQHNSAHYPIGLFSSEKPYTS